MRTVLLLLFVLSAAPIHAAPEPVSPERFAADIVQFEQQDRQDPPKPGAILFVGSSSIRLWQDLAADFPDRHVLNRGFGGSQIADLTYYAGRLVVPCRPSRIVFYAGDNDLADGRTPEQVLADFDAFVVRLRRDLPGVPIAFISIKPSPARASLIPLMRDANARIARYAAWHRRISYIDVFTPMLAECAHLGPTPCKTIGGAARAARAATPRLPLFRVSLS